MQGDLKTACTLINLSLAKIRELHGGFKSICDNFAINLTEFETIFTSTDRMCCGCFNVIWGMRPRTFGEEV